MLNKYYVGAEHISRAIENGDNQACTFATLEEAIEAAKQQVRNGRRGDTAIVVEITHVIRREIPITVESV